MCGGGTWGTVCQERKSRFDSWDVFNQIKPLFFFFKDNKPTRSHWSLSHEFNFRQNVQYFSLKCNQEIWTASQAGQSSKRFQKLGHLFIIVTNVHKQLRRRLNVERQVIVRSRCWGQTAVEVICRLQLHTTGNKLPFSQRERTAAQTCRRDLCRKWHTVVYWQAGNRDDDDASLAQPTGFVTR